MVYAKQNLKSGREKYVGPRLVTLPNTYCMFCGYYQSNDS